MVVGVSDAKYYRTTEPPFTNPVLIRTSTENVRLRKNANSSGETDRWERVASGIENQYSTRFGTLIGPVELVFHVCLLRGLKRLDNGALRKDFGDIRDSKEFPMQAVVYDRPREDSRFAEKDALNLDEEFPVGAKGFYLGEPGYGSPCKVTGHGTSGRSLNLSVSIESRPIPTFGRDVAKLLNGSERYFPSHVVAKRVGTSNFVISKITASLYLLSDVSGADKINIGLNIKFEARQLKVIGYSRRTDHSGWEYSQTAVELLQEYNQLFPEVFQRIGKSQEFFSATDVFGSNAKKRVDELKAWIKEKVFLYIIIQFAKSNRSNGRFSFLGYQGF